ncbi:MAG: glycerophosphodiester phosphodiesterase [Gammaproteobacteria bacterium]|nr:glycerophosphodiester phosphodiesterase [Gammaproteobacteria bacterium]MYD79357.1 glycerophosphodiester phosphodiesterase [Gammaproteobacteria bacterium]
MQDTSSFKVIGHRGAAALEPENTLRSFTRAVREGVDAIEFDVQFVDGNVVVLHDDSVDRTSNSSGLASSFSFEGIRELDFGLGERIPTLEEAVDSIPPNVLVNVELKSKNAAIPSLEVLRNFSDREFLVSSFRMSELEIIAKAAINQKNLEIGLLHLGLDRNVFPTATRIGARVIGLCDPFVQVDTVDSVRSRGYELYVFTVNALDRARELKSLGASGVFTDAPDKINSRSLCK